MKVNERKGLKCVSSVCGIRGTLLCFLMLTCFALPCHAESAKALYFGDVAVSPGADKTDVLSKLRRHYELKETDGGAFLVFKRGGPPYEPVGSVLFDQNGKLSFANQYWSDASGHEAQNLGRALLSLLEKYSFAEGTSLAVLRVSPGARAPDVRSTDIEIRFVERLASAVNAGEQSSPERLNFELSANRVEISVIESSPMFPNGAVSVSESVVAK